MWLPPKKEPGLKSERSWKEAAGLARSPQHPRCVFPPARCDWNLAKLCWTPPHQMQLVPLQPVPPASVPLLSQLLTHQLIPLPGYSCLEKKEERGRHGPKTSGSWQYRFPAMMLTVPLKTHFQTQSLIWCLFGWSSGLMLFVGGERPSGFQVQQSTAKWADIMSFRGFVPEDSTLWVPKYWVSGCMVFIPFAVSDLLIEPPIPGPAGARQLWAGLSTGS